ncbi:hypothetical protein [Nocardia farcinica]|uniref:hypothetical protein n=1 Tax=Nocardia farcinica TaxID=37329 RepID=UPI002456DC0D|nr:hypothetical protein [Nocardia farcinica]
MLHDNSVRRHPADPVRNSKKQLTDLESVDVGSAEFETRLAALRQAVLTHAEHEETEEFNRLRAEIDGEELRRLRSTVELAEAMAPTRPHPGVESAKANVLAGPFAAMMDRAKDLISKPR